MPTERVVAVVRSHKMIKVIADEGKTTQYQCEECGFHYEDKEWAKKCEVWCKDHKSCNLEITSHAVENKQ
jgi:hypothetical protein